MIIGHGCKVCKITSYMLAMHKTSPKHLYNSRELTRKTVGSDESNNHLTTSHMQPIKNTSLDPFILPYIIKMNAACSFLLNPDNIELNR